jgi:uncharacterized protein (DUF736 family)
MIIGKFIHEDDGYTGVIYSIGLACRDVTFIPVPVKQGNGPDFVILGSNGDDECEFGVAWAKTSKKDKPYLSVKLDSPALVQPINCALTQQANGTHNLVWSRDARKEDEQATA